MGIAHLCSFFLLQLFQAGKCGRQKLKNNGSIDQRNNACAVTNPNNEPLKSSAIQHISSALTDLGGDIKFNVSLTLGLC